MEEKARQEWQSALKQNFQDSRIKLPEFWKQWPDDVQDWLQKTLGIDLYSEFAENDWSLIVKLHAMIEAALNSAITARLDTPELEAIVARLDTSNPRTGKVGLR